MRGRKWVKLRRQLGSELAAFVAWVWERGIVNVTIFLLVFVFALVGYALLFTLLAAAGGQLW